RVWPRDPTGAGCFLERSAAPGRKGSVLHGREPGGSVRPCEGAELSVARGRARCTGRWHRGAPVGRAIGLCRGPLGKSPVFRRRGNGLHGVSDGLKGASGPSQACVSSRLTRARRPHRLAARARHSFSKQPIGGGRTCGNVPHAAFVAIAQGGIGTGKSATTP